MIQAGGPAQEGITSATTVHHHHLGLDRVLKSSSDSTMRPRSMGEKSNITFSDSVKSLN